MKTMILVIVVAFLLAAFSCERWKYQECRKVGNGKAYCIMRVGE